MWRERPASALRPAAQALAIFLLSCADPALAAGPPPAVTQVESRSNDRWFQHVAIIVSDMAAAYARLRSFNVQHASSGPQRLPDWNRNAGGIEAFYFRDPDGHNLEVLAFPAGKGLARWH